MGTIIAVILILMLSYFLIDTLATIFKAIVAIWDHYKGSFHIPHT